MKDDFAIENAASMISLGVKLRDTVNKYSSDGKVVIPTEVVVAIAEMLMRTGEWIAELDEKIDG